VQENNLQRMFQTQDMAGQRINGNSMEKLLLAQQKQTPLPPAYGPAKSKWQHSLVDSDPLQSRGQT
jgi:hypothetical protein